MAAMGLFFLILAAFFENLSVTMGLSSLAFLLALGSLGLWSRQRSEEQPHRLGLKPAEFQSMVEARTRQLTLALAESDAKDRVQDATMRANHDRWKVSKKR